MARKVVEMAVGGGDQGRSPPGVGCRGQSPCRGVRGAVPPELYETNFIEFNNVWKSINFG